MRRSSARFAEWGRSIGFPSVTNDYWLGTSQTWIRLYASFTAFWSREDEPSWLSATAPCAASSSGIQARLCTWAAVTDFDLRDDDVGVFSQTADTCRRRPHDVPEGCFETGCARRFSSTL